MNEKILCIIAGGLGDCIYYSYIFSAIKRKYPQSSLTCVVWSHGYPHPFRNNPFIDSIIEVKDLSNLNKNRELQAAIAGQHFDAVYAINHLKQLYYYLETCTFDRFFAHYSYDEAYRKAVPPAFLKLIDDYKAEGIVYPFFDLPPVSKAYEVYCSDADIARARKIMEESIDTSKKTIVWQLFSDDIERTIPMKLQASILKDLQRDYDVFAIGRVPHMSSAAEKYQGFYDLASSGARLLIDTDESEELGLCGHLALINEADYFVSPLTMTIALADCAMTPTITVFGYRQSIQDLIVQFCHYCPNIAILLDDVALLSPDHIREAISHFYCNPKWKFSYARNKTDDMIHDYRQVHSEKNSTREGEDNY